jgi:acyl carrier protein
MSNSIETRLRRFIADNFLFADNVGSISADASLIDDGVIDSTGVLELVGFLESEFGIRIADAEIVPENLGSIGGMTAFVAAKTKQAA